MSLSRDAIATGPADGALKPLSLIDCDIHQSPASPKEIQKYLPAFWRQRGLAGGGAGYANPHGVNRDDAIPPGGGLPGSDPKYLGEHLLDAYGVDFGILTGSGILGLGVSPNVDHASATARAYNDCLIEEWLPQDERFLGSVLLAPQDPQAAAEEIRRVGNHPQMVQTMMTSATRIPYGQKFYHPIYEAAQEMNLPVAVHPGQEGGGISNTFAAGYPSTYFEWHTNLSQNYQAQLVSLVLEGVFEKFPRLKWVCVEGGVAWLPHLMWRLDKNYKALRQLTPWLKRMPSKYVIDHVRFTTQPIEEPANPQHLLQIFEMIRADKILMYSSDYPHWDFDSPVAAFPKMPAELKERIFWKNAQELYGLPAQVPVREVPNG
jgi:predicted TIM-barrel fold metal-dependent hydrolase